MEKSILFMEANQFHKFELRHILNKIRLIHCILVLELDGFEANQPFFKCIVAQRNESGKILLPCSSV